MLLEAKYVCNYLKVLLHLPFMQTSIVPNQNILYPTFVTFFLSSIYILCRCILFLLNEPSTNWNIYSMSTCATFSLLSNTKFRVGIAKPDIKCKIDTLIGFFFHNSCSKAYHINYLFPIFT